MFPRLLTALLLLLFVQVHAQQNIALIDSLKTKFAQAKTSEAKVETAGMLARVLMNTNIAEADKYGKLMSEEAEISRDRKLMVKALLIQGERYSYFIINKDFVQKSLDYYNQAYELARQNKLDLEVGSALLGLSTVYRQLPDLDKSLNYTTQAFAVASALENDSLKAEVYNSFGKVYMYKRERLLSLRNYLNAMKIAEEIKNHSLLRSSYSNLSKFYADIKEYDKGIDYARSSMNELSYLKTTGALYSRVVDLNFIANLYLQKKNFDMSAYYFEKSLKLADSLKYAPLKVPAYNGLLNQYIEAHQPEKALAYFNNSPELKQFIMNGGLTHVIDEAYGIIYTDLGKYDSARYYMERAAPVFEKASTLSSKLPFYTEFARLYNKEGNTQMAIAYYLRAKDLAEKTADLDWQQDISKELDTLYAKTGDYRQSYLYSNLYHKYKDSIQKLGEEKDLMQMELADEQQRQERIAKEEAIALEKRHNLEYTGITVVIGIMFLLLVLLGIFQVSVTTIKIMGFFSFILLFEFITMIADTKIHHWTEGEPLKVLGIKIVLIALMLPLHHWLEHRVVSYLASRRLIIPSGKGIWTNIIAKGKTVNH